MGAVAGNVVPLTALAALLATASAQSGFVGILVLRLQCRDGGRRFGDFAGARQGATLWEEMNMLPCECAIPRHTVHRERCPLDHSPPQDMA